MAIIDQDRAAIIIQSCFRRHRARVRIIVKTRALFHQIAEELADDPTQIAWPSKYRPVCPVWATRDPDVGKQNWHRAELCPKAEYREDLERPSHHLGLIRNSPIDDIEVSRDIINTPNLSSDDRQEDDVDSEAELDPEALGKLLRDLAWAQKAVIDRCLFLNSKDA